MKLLRIIAYLIHESWKRGIPWAFTRIRLELQRIVFGMIASQMVSGTKALPVIIFQEGEGAVIGVSDIEPPKRVTTHRESNEQLLYFTSSSLTAGDRQLIFLSDRLGPPNLFVRDLQNAEECQISDNREGILKSYVYFDGQIDHGLGMASACLDPARGVVFYVQDRNLLRARLNGEREIMAELPPHQMTAYTSVSIDGRFWCVPTVDARALEDNQVFRHKPLYDVDGRIRKEGLSSYLRVYDTTSGLEVFCEAIPGAWVTHVQFSPSDNSVILYNHEWADGSGLRRMWIWDGNRHIAVRTMEAGRALGDWVCHEIWSRDGKSIIYHGKYKNGQDFLGRCTPSDGRIIELPLAPGWSQYGHYNILGAGVLISDGYYRGPAAEFAVHCPWLSRVDVDWEKKEMTWAPLGRHSSSWQTQDSHPHPIFDHAGTQIYFTSDFEGKRAVYKVQNRLKLPS